MNQFSVITIDIFCRAKTWHCKRYATERLDDHGLGARVRWHTHVFMVLLPKARDGSRKRSGNPLLGVQGLRHTFGGAPLSKGLERIFPGTFVDCVSLREISIPVSVIKVIRSFTGCVRLEAVHVAKDNPAYCDIDDVMYDWDLTRLIVFPWIARLIQAFPKTLCVVDRESLRSYPCPDLFELRLSHACTTAGSRRTQ